MNYLKTSKIIVSFVLSLLVIVSPTSIASPAHTASNLSNVVVSAINDSGRIGMATSSNNRYLFKNHI